MYKPCNVVMLSTNEKANYSHIYTTLLDEKIEVMNLNQIILNLDTYKLSLNKNSGWSITADTDVLIPQHLYITSNDEIKKSDWYLVELFKITGESIGLHLEQCKTINDVWVNNSDVILTRHIDNCKKMIASTDSSLSVKAEQAGKNAWYNPLPQIPQQFIEHYVSEYNKGNVINEVMVEYYHTHETTGDKPLCVKLNQDNTINIKPVKDNFSKKDIMNAIHKVELKHNKDYSKLWEEIEQNL